MAQIKCSHCREHTSMCELCGYCECISEFVSGVIQSTSRNGWACPDNKCSVNELKTLLRHEEHREMVEDTLVFDPAPMSFRG
jgi:hypothetical protein